jgi:uncharacterized protein YaaN involved in tellurite resistance
MNDIDSKLIEIEHKVHGIEKKLDRIIELLEKDCKKMVDHIDFVETVYDSVKMPFYYVMDKVSLLSSNRILHSS